MTSVIARPLTTIARLIAGLAAVCAVGLSVILLGELQSTQLPSSVYLERLRLAPALTEGLDRLVATEPDGRDVDGVVDAPAIVDRVERSWFLVRIPVPAAAIGADLVVNFSHGLVVPDRIWRIGGPVAIPDGPTLVDALPALLADGRVTALPLAASVAGRWVPLDGGPDAEVRLIARIASPGVGQPKAQLFRAADRIDAVHSHVVRTVTFTSVLLILACFSAAVAISSRDWTFLIFSAWLLMSLRLVAVNSGWGLEWAAEQVSPAVLGALSRITLDLYGFFTLALYRGLVAAQTGKVFGQVLRVMQWSFFGLGLASVVVPEGMFYYAFWGLSAVSMVAMILHASWLSVLRRNSVAFLFLVSWGLTFAGMGAEILYSAGALTRFGGLLGAETGALGGILACALALAQRLRTQIVARQAASWREIRASRALKKNYESMPIGLFSCDGLGRFQLSNPAFKAIFESATGLVPQPGQGSLADLVGVQSMAALLERAVARDETPELVEIKRPAAPSVWLQFRLGATEAANGVTIEGSVSDVSARVAAERRLEHLVDHDPETGALNQRGLIAAIDVAIAEAATGKACALLDYHVDRFKMVNDLHGLATGDAVLIAVHERLRLGAGPEVPIARVGDTFKFVFVGYGDAEALVVAERLITLTANEPFEAEGKRLSLTASAGLVAISAAMNSRDVLTAASNASADAKVHGRNQVVQSKAADRAFGRYLEDLSLQATLRDRLASDRFFLQFQPIVDLRDPFGHLAFEALVRLRDDGGNVICPSRFVPAAERNGQISLIDRWVLESTLLWLANHPRIAAKLSYATVNLSGASLNDARFIDEILAVVAQYPTLARKLCFEVTETVALADRRATRRFADRVHSMGGFIALDDFGAGYTSFAYLKEIDADVIKIDGSFVRDLHENPQNMAITRTITDLAHQFGKRCVAEWVETADTVAALQSLSVDFAQGFALGRPMDPQHFDGVASAGALIRDPAIIALLGGDPQPGAIAASAFGSRLEK